VCSVRVGKSSEFGLVCGFSIAGCLVVDCEERQVLV
jgi:hypothetical protein